MIYRILWFSGRIGFIFFYNLLQIKQNLFDFFYNLLFIKIVIVNQYILVGFESVLLDDIKFEVKV